jgi:hypothetical protein
LPKGRGSNSGRACETHNAKPQEPAKHQWGLQSTQDNLHLQVTVQIEVVTCGVTRRQTYTTTHHLYPTYLSQSIKKGGASEGFEDKMQQLRPLYTQAAGKKDCVRLQESSGFAKGEGSGRGMQTSLRAGLEFTNCLAGTVDFRQVGRAILFP